MTRSLPWCLLTIVTCVHSLAAGTYNVGSCRSGSYPTISAAVNDSNVAAGSTINVCPGAYGEQVVISKPLTIQGISSNNSSRSYVALSTTFSTTKSSVLGSVLAPTIWVTATGGPVNISNILADVSCSVPSGTMAVGIYYASGSSGTVNHITARGCGAGVWVENSSSEIEGITIENSAIGAIVSQVASCTCQETLTYGIVAASQQPPGTIPVLGATISGNHIQDASYGIYLRGGGGTTSGNSITSNLYPNVQTYGIWDAAPSTTVSHNVIINTSGVSTGVFIGAANASVTNNNITSSSVGIDFACRLATVTGNTISSAGDGLYRVPSAFAGTNTFYVVKNNRVGC